MGNIRLAVREEDARPAAHVEDVTGLQAERCTVLGPGPEGLVATELFTRKQTAAALTRPAVARR